MNRKNITKILAVAVMLILVASAAACGSSAPKQEKTQVADTGTGLKITLPESLQKDSMDGFDLFYYNDEFMVSVITESNELLTNAGFDLSNLDLKGYSDLVAQANGVDFTQNADGNYIAEYDRTLTDGDFHYYTTVAQGPQGYYVVTFACFADEQDKYVPVFADLIKTIETY
ncbi:MAG: hypothetical protein IIZ17_08010 [Eubacteriaceae bacterium]|nr:hypothetical protein [Eubacteriaceae bacterium]MBQ1466603.1 hypothetical protein [Eubacteriaceae bacterium]